ncbi:MAG: hemolysin III family protein [Clostridia bacterium]|nr:hemolysin III family protein [Clostridia bacterium]
MKYSIGEEIANAITHGLGAIFALVALIIMIVFAALFGNIWQVVSVSIYGSTMLILFTMSTLYHSFTTEKLKRLFKIFDHASIYLLIAGTYTPFTLVVLRGDGIIGWVLFLGVWITAILGIIFSSIFIGKYRILKTFTYLIMGWAIMFAMPDLISIMQAKNSLRGIYWLCAGGLAYTVGAVFYMIKVKYFHSIWHLLVLLGSIFHFVSIILYVL